MDTTHNNESNDLKKPIRTGNVTKRSYVEWVPISEIIPNPLNPRKDDSVKTEELQEILKQGWEMPITCYRKGSMYVVLSGHRRLYAARQMKVKELPVFLVEAPATHQQEVERIARAQLAQEDWTALEWARFTYERWLSWGKPPMKKFAEQIHIRRRTVEGYIRVLDYFPLHEIEPGLNTKAFSIRFLEGTAAWIKKLNVLHHGVVESLTEDMIRRILLDKIISKKISRESIEKRDFLERVSDDDIKNFLIDKEMHLEDLMGKYEFDVKEKTFHAQLVSLGWARKSVKNIHPKNQKEAETAFQKLQEMQESIKDQAEYLKRKYPNVAKKDDLFDWE